MAETESGKSIFREKALEQLSSPEQLDELLRVTTRRSWLSVGTVAAALFLVLIWSLVGQIPIVVNGSGILVYPHRVVSLQSPATGQIIDLNVQVGDFVDLGALLGRLNQPELVQQLEHERMRLTEASRRSDQSEALRDKRAELELRALARKRTVFVEQVSSLRAYAKAQRKRNESYLNEQKINVERMRGIRQDIGKALEERYNTYRRLFKEGLSSEDTVLSARERLVSGQIQVADMALRAQEIEMDRLKGESDYQEQLNRIADLEMQIQEIATREAELEQQHVEADADREVRIHEIQRNIERYEEELHSKGHILSKYRGRILELNVSPGQIVSAGERLGSLEAEDTDAKLVAASYFSVGDGKKLKVGDEIHITPTTVERARFGSILGKIVSVTPFPVTIDAIASVIGSRKIAMELVQNRSKIGVIADLELDGESHSGYRWTSGKGPEMKVTTGTTASLQATVERRRPITFVLPILRGWGGI